MYPEPPQEIIDSALKSGDWAAFFGFVGSSDDIALIELAELVCDVAPARMYDGPVLGKVVRIMGRGATGTGSKGHGLGGPNRTDLRHGYNEITVSEGRWMAYTFDKPPNALPLEASIGSGDSGGPILVAVDNEWHVAGVAAWKRGVVKGKKVFQGAFGETSYGARLGQYADWIENTTARVPPARKAAEQRGDARETVRYRKRGQPDATLQRRSEGKPAHERADAHQEHDFRCRGHRDRRVRICCRVGSNARCRHQRGHR